MSQYKIDLNGQVALITGGYRGIGGGCTKLFSEAGAQCVITGRRPMDEDVKVFCDEIEKLYGKRPYYIQSDIGVEKDIINMVNEINEKYGHIDMVVANAGGAHSWEENIRNNIYGTDWLMREVAPYLAKAEKGGKMVIVSSNCILYGGHGSQQADYIAAKGGEEALTRLYARRYAKDNVRINCVLPGPILSDGMIEMMGGIDVATKHYEAMLPLGKMGKVEDLAGVCLFLCCELSRYITAQTFNVDGGRFLIGN